VSETGKEEKRGQTEKERTPGRAKRTKVRNHRQETTAVAFLEPNAKGTPPYQGGGTFFPRKAQGTPYKLTSTGARGQNLVQKNTKTTNNNGKGGNRGIRTKGKRWTKNGWTRAEVQKKNGPYS